MKLPACSVTLSLALFACANATAADDDWLTRSTLTGDWDGQRSALVDSGIDLKLAHISESAWGFEGGRDQGARYTQELRFSAEFDFAKLFDIEGGRLRFGLLDRRGRNLSADRTGNLFMTQELYGGGMDTRIGELTYEQAMAGNRWNLKFGLTHTGDDFASSPLNCNFQNFAFCPRPPALGSNSGFSGYPVPRWGARLRWAPTASFYAQTGIYEVNNDRTQHDNGWRLRIESGSALLPFEFGWKSGTGQGELPGLYRIGGYYDSTNTADVHTDIDGASFVLNGTRAELHEGRYGLWLMGEQMLFRDAGNASRNLSVFANVLGFDRETSRYSRFYSAGLVWRGPFDARPGDSTGIAIANVKVNPRLAATQRDRLLLSGSPGAVQNDETSLELFYGVQVAPWLLIRPNLQFIHRPGATGLYDDAWLLGLSTRINF
jgi:porin